MCDSLNVCVTIYPLAVELWTKVDGRAADKTNNIFLNNLLSLEFTVQYNI